MADLLIHNDVTVAVYVMHLDVVISIRWCAGLVYALHLPIQDISLEMNCSTVTHYGLRVNPDINHIHDHVPDLA